MADPFTDDTFAALALGDEPPDYVDQWLDGEGEHDDPAVVEWCSTDDQAEWAMRKLAKSHVALIEATIKRDAWQARIDEWYGDVTQADRSQVERLTALLERYAVACRARGRKTVLLPSGEIATRRDKESHIDIADEKAVLLWAREHFQDDDEYESFVTVKHSPLISRLREVIKIVDGLDDDGTGRAVFDDSGGIVPGVVIVDPHTTANVKPRYES